MIVAIKDDRYSDIAGKQWTYKFLKLQACLRKNNFATDKNDRKWLVCKNLIEMQRKKGTHIHIKLIETK